MQGAAPWRAAAGLENAQNFDPADRPRSAAAQHHTTSGQRPVHGQRRARRTLCSGPSAEAVACFTHGQRRYRTSRCQGAVRVHRAQREKKHTARGQGLHLKRLKSAVQLARSGSRLLTSTTGDRPCTLPPIIPPIAIPPPIMPPPIKPWSNPPIPTLPMPPAPRPPPRPTYPGAPPTPPLRAPATAPPTRPSDPCDGNPWSHSDALPLEPAAARGGEVSFAPPFFNPRTEDRFRGAGRGARRHRRGALEADLWAFPRAVPARAGGR